MTDKEASLKSVARLRADAEIQAGRALREADQRLAAEQTQLESVRSMLADYLKRASWGSGGPRELRDTRYFIKRLQVGVEAQEAAVDQQRRATEAARAHWVSARLQREAIDQVIDERRVAEAVRRERRDQRAADDRAARGRADPFAPPGKDMTATG